MIIKRRDFLRFLIVSIILVVLVFVIKVDLQEGTIPLASFYANTTNCERTDEITYVSVQVMEGDTIYSLFSATPSPTKMMFTERLTKFYELNPHLQLQKLVPGETILLPLSIKAPEKCIK